MWKPAAKKSKTKRKPPKDTDFVQSFIPVKDIRNGIVETTDGRYVKILEVGPVNFGLRSSEEQYSILCSFAGWLKIAPVDIQLKSVTRKADSERHVRAVLEDLKSEENEQCRKMAEDYISLVRRVGTREALTRRFFLIFQYEPPSRADGGDYRAVRAALDAAVRNARAYLSRCGNDVYMPENPDRAAAEILYMFFNRRSCAVEPFESRIRRVAADTLALKRNRKKKPGQVISEIPVTDYIAPRGLIFSKPDCFIMDGQYFSVLYIKADGYPSRVRGGWVSTLVNAGDGVDVDVFLHREERGRTVDQVARRIRLNRVKLKNMQDTSSDYEELSGAVQAGFYIKDRIATCSEDLFYMTIMITISAPTYEILKWRRRRIRDFLKSRDFAVSECRFQQEDALKSVMPLGKLSPKLKKKTRRNILTSGAAGTYMFSSFEMSDDSGVLMGVNRYNDSLCILDLFDTKVNKNANMTMIGTSGAGKTFTLQLLALRMRMRGIQCFIVAPIKGHEFKRACERIGGQFIKIAPGSPHCINVMEIRDTQSPEMELIDGSDYNGEDSMLARKIQQMMTFFTLLVPDMTNEEEQMLDEALIRTYEEFGITHDNDSLFEYRNGQKVMKTMPVLGDLHKILQDNPMTGRLAIILSRFVTGSAKSFNRQTNVDLSNKYIVLDLSELKGRLLPVGMMIAVDYVWDVIKKDRTKKKAILIDEIWTLIGASSSEMAAQFCLEIFKVIRGYGGAAIASTQDMSDFFGLEDGKYGRAIINNSKNKIILNLEPDEAETVKDVLKLTPTEVRTITRFERGEALIASNSNKIPVLIRASDLEKEMITTDRAELEAILKKRRAAERAERGEGE